KVERWLEENPKFRLLFLPMYSPWLNPIEPTVVVVTRNHNEKSSVSVHVAVTETGSTIYECRFTVSRQSTGSG
ncbi:ransposase of, partial [Salmonella enterica subsp. enterica serovar Enteritidis str. 543463 22-17]